MVAAGDLCFPTPPLEQSESKGEEMLVIFGNEDSLLKWILWSLGVESIWGTELSLPEATFSHFPKISDS